MEKSPYIEAINQFLGPKEEARRIFASMVEQRDAGDANAKNILDWLKVAFEAGRDFEKQHGSQSGDV